MDRITKQGHTTFSPIHSRWAVIYVTAKNRFLFSCINQIYDIVTPTTEYLKQSFLFTCQCLVDDKHVGHIKVELLLSIRIHFTYMYGNFTPSTHHFQGQCHQPLLYEKHTIAFYQHQHLKRRSIVCDQEILGTFNRGKEGRVLL